MDNIGASFEQTVAEIPKWLHRFLTPKPILLLFREGGQLQGYNEDAVLFLFILAALFLLDVLVARPMGKKHDKIRWYALHAIVNAVVVIASLPDLVRALTVHPYNVFVGPSHPWTVFGTTAIAALHFYFIVAFSSDADEIFHHSTFLLGFIVYGMPLKHDVGGAVAIANIFLSGIVGGLNYVLLILVLQGKMEMRKQKQLFATLNVYVRAPGAVFFVFFGWSSWREGVLLGVPTVVAFACGVLVLYNAMYYTQRAVESNTRYEFNLKAAAPQLELDKSLPPGSPSGINALLGDDGVTPRRSAEFPSADSQTMTNKKKRGEETAKNK